MAVGPRVLTFVHMTRALPADFMPASNFLPFLEAVLAAPILVLSCDAGLGSSTPTLVLRKAAPSSLGHR